MRRPLRPRRGSPLCPQEGPLLSRRGQAPWAGPPSPPPTCPRWGSEAGTISPQAHQVLKLKAPWDAPTWVTLEDISQSQRTNPAGFHTHEVPRVIKPTEIESRMVVPGVRGEELPFHRDSLSPVR